MLVVRHGHKSVISGLISSGVEPVWVHPNWDGERHLAHPPSAEKVTKALRDDSDAKGLLVTPTDYGTCGDIEKIADACRAHDRTLIVDEAWGAHLPFHPDLPPRAMDRGADLCVTSVHKIGAAIERALGMRLRVCGRGWVFWAC
ncbi:hypothetical protein [Fodinicola acaciae]|uniref:hypothetical protein n=1 Tax=Fodinicola acaciae TaxID=2681555 RepID=UPI002483E40A|nr:hypothetical protein [Fodinicola acaciae]